MPVTLAFDVYGTLIDTHGVVDQLHEYIGEDAKAFSQTWRDKQLEYAFRRGLMRSYAPFSVCTSNALDYACLVYGVDLSVSQKDRLLEHYRSLPPFSDVKTSMARLKESDCRLFAFSNGTADAVSALLINAGISGYFESVISVDDVKSFKPNPAVYHHLLEKAESQSESTWLVSSNPFDVIGAISAGINAAWLKRSENAVFDQWGIEPTLTIESLDALRERFAGQ